MDRLYQVDKIKIPVIPLRGIWVFPHNLIHFDVGRDKSIRAINKCQASEDKLLFLITQKDAMVEDPKRTDCYEIGTLVRLRDVYQLQDGGIRVLVEGLCRAKPIDELKNDDYLEWIIDTYRFLPEKLELTKDVLENITFIKKLLNKYAELHPLLPDKPSIGLGDDINVEVFTDKIASLLRVDSEEFYNILSTIDPIKRLEIIKEALSKELYILQLEDKINVRVRNQMNKSQKEYYLKEKIRAIHEELGEGEDYQAELEELKKAILEKEMPKEVTEKALKELKRLGKSSFNYAEAGVIRNYIDWLLDLPWKSECEYEYIDINYAREILDKDHYGLDDVKDRIIEYLAVKQLNPDAKGNILLFVGPPGVGKTSIAKSIAKALHRPFVRMSLGGITDEAEIRGHRRTYVGAMPGRIISGMKKAGKNNPVFLLDEIDKINSDFRGDPASALLEVLDPEQNKDFRDNYLDLPYDLSHVLFLTTANSYNIPPALLDRMEVIHISGYTDDEKLNIAQKYLIKKQMKNNGVTTKNFRLNKSAVIEIIEHYTREAGVRELERLISKVIRKSVVKLLSEDIEKIAVSKKDIEDILGPRKYTFDLTDKKDRIGVATGLAWTSVGGSTLQVETIISPGNGKVKLTGKLGDVMKESALAAVSYIRSNSKSLNVEKDFYKKYDIHVHVPEGAVPKDGPSAGITIATSILSALTKKPVDRYVAMTGELTLTGRVLPIGGLKSKVLAAQRMGIKTIILPNDNKKDMVDIPDKAKENLEFLFVKNIGEVFSRAIR